MDGCQVCSLLTALEKGKSERALRPDPLKLTRHVRHNLVESQLAAVSILQTVTRDSAWRLHIEPSQFDDQMAGIHVPMQIRFVAPCNSLV
jgi:hypothetical protein